MNVFELEKKMIPVNEWKTSGVPLEMLIRAESLSEEGVSTGLSHDDKLGWCILCTGQGPFIAESEFKRKN